MSAFSWFDLSGEHAFAFTVAEAVDAELLAQFWTIIRRSLDTGQSFEGLVRELLESRRPLVID